MPYRKTIFLAAVSVLLSAVFARAQEQEDSDSLIRLDYGKTAELIEINGQNVRKVIGPAEFMHNNTFMLCDTALWNLDTQIIDAIGNVSIIQEGTVLTSESMVYYIDDDLAQFRGHLVQLVDSDNNTLRTSWLDYNTKDSVAVFDYGGSMRDKDGQLIESIQGTYDAKIKLFTFKDDVNMFTDSIFVKTSYLEYESDLNLATFGRETDAWKDESMLSADAGWYDRDREIFFFRNNVHVMNDTQEGWSDSLYYYRNTMDVEMLGRAQVTDTSRSVTAVAGKITYIDSISTVTLLRDPAIIIETEQDDKRDTVYIGADTLVYYTLRMCDVDSVVVANAQKRLEELDVDPVGTYRAQAAEAARKSAEEKAKDDPNRPPTVMGGGASDLDISPSDDQGRDDGEQLSGADDRGGPDDDIGDDDRGGPDDDIGDDDRGGPDDLDIGRGSGDDAAADDMAGSDLRNDDDDLDGGLGAGGEVGGRANSERRNGVIDDEDRTGADADDEENGDNDLDEDPDGIGGIDDEGARSDFGGMDSGEIDEGTPDFGIGSTGIGGMDDLDGRNDNDISPDGIPDRGEGGVEAKAGIGGGEVTNGADSLSFGRDSLNFGADSLGFGRDSLNFGADSLGFGRDSLNFGTDSLGFGRDSLNFGADSLGFGRDSLNFGADSLGMGNDSLNVNDGPVEPLDTTEIGFVWAVSNVRLFREDIQMVCDSLEYNDLDSLVRMYKETVIWNEITQQYSADSVFAVIKNQNFEKASLMSDSYIVIEEEPDAYYDQVKSVEALAFFDSTGTLTRFDALGSATGFFFLREEDVVATANKTESKMLSAIFVDGNIDKVYYFNDVKNDAYPVVQIAKEDQTFKGFKWQPERRPAEPADVTTVTPKPPMRAIYKSRPRAAFDQTELYFPGYIPNIYKEIAQRDSLERVRARQRQLAEELAERERLDSLLRDSLALADSLSARDSLGALDSLAAADSLAVEDSLMIWDRLALNDSIEIANNQAYLDSIFLAETMALADSLYAANRVYTKEELRERAKAQKEAERQRREEAQQQRLEEREAKWDARDSVDAEKAAAKQAQKDEKAREKKRRYLEREAQRDAKEDARLENYVKRIETQEDKLAAKGKPSKIEKQMFTKPMSKRQIKKAERKAQKSGGGAVEPEDSLETSVGVSALESAQTPIGTDNMIDIEHPQEDDSVIDVHSFQRVAVGEPESDDQDAADRPEGLEFIERPFDVPEDESDRRHAVELDDDMDGGILEDSDRTQEEMDLEDEESEADYIEVSDNDEPRDYDDMEGLDERGDMTADEVNEDDSMADVPEEEMTDSED